MRENYQPFAQELIAYVLQPMRFTTYDCYDLDLYDYLGLS